MAQAARATRATVPPAIEPAAADQDASASHPARQWRPERHGAAFYRTIIHGAFERIYRPDGSYRLREIGSGRFLEEVAAAEPTRAKAPAE